MQKLFIRGKREERAPGRMLGVTGLSGGSGVTTAASSAALFFAGEGYRVRFTECADHRGTADALLYEAAGFEERFWARGIRDVYGAALREEALPESYNPELGVEWLVRMPGNCADEREITDEIRGRIFRLGMRAEVSVFDFGFCGDGWLPYLGDLDVLLVLVDPMPSQVGRNRRRFEMLKALEVERRVKVHWIVNRMCDSVVKRDMREFIRSRRICWVPELGRDVFCQDEYRCRFHWENEKIRNALKPAFQEIFGAEGWISNAEQ